MAKNWTVGQAARAIHAGEKEAIFDIGRRFPLFAVLAAQANAPALEIFDAMPEYMTARKVESILKGDVQGSEDDGNEDAEPAAPAKTNGNGKPANKPAAKSNEEVLEGKTPKELFTLAKELGIAVEPKQPAEIYIKAIKKHQAAEAKKAAAAAKSGGKDDDEWGDEPAAKKDEPKSAKSDDDWDL